MKHLLENGTDLTDEELVILAKSGNSAAADILVQRMYPVVYYLSKNNSSTLENADLIQEGMIGLIYAIRSFSPQIGVKFKTYAKSCIRNQIISLVRSQYQKKKIPQEKLVSINEYFIQDTVPSPEEHVIANEKSMQLMSRFETQLSDFELNILKKYLSGYSAAEIAELLGINVKRVSNALYRIRQKFHSLIK